MLKKVSTLLSLALVMGALAAHSDWDHDGRGGRGPGGGRGDGWHDPRNPGGYPGYPGYPGRPGAGNPYDDIAASRALYASAMQLAQAAYMRGDSYLGLTATNLANQALQARRGMSFMLLQNTYMQTQMAASRNNDFYMQQLFQRVTMDYNTLLFAMRT